MPSTVDYKKQVTAFLTADGMILHYINLTVTEEQRLRMLENVVVRKLFRPEREKEAKR
jgi:hypothetical protein